MFNSLDLINLQTTNIPGISDDNLECDSDLKRTPFSPRSLETALNEIFPSQQAETKLQKARQVLNETATGISDEDLQKYAAEFQCLIDSWLDCFEKEVFDGQTLGQILREGQ